MRIFGKGKGLKMSVGRGTATGPSKKKAEAGLNIAVNSAIGSSPNIKLNGSAQLNRYDAPEPRLTTFTPGNLAPGHLPAWVSSRMPSSFHFGGIQNRDFALRKFTDDLNTYGQQAPSSVTFNGVYNAASAQWLIFMAADVATVPWIGSQASFFDIEIFSSDSRQLINALDISVEQAQGDPTAAGLAGAVPVRTPGTNDFQNLTYPASSGGLLYFRAAGLLCVEEAASQRVDTGAVTSIFTAAGPPVVSTGILIKISNLPNNAAYTVQGRFAYAGSEGTSMYRNRIGV